MSIVKDPEETRFANVDLDIHSRSNLQPLVAAMGKKISVLYAGRVRRHYEAHLELYRYTQDADSTIRGFCALIRRLPRAERKLWDDATIREFNIGIHARMKPITFEIAIREAAVKEASELNARIGFTIYSPAMKTVTAESLLSSTKERSC
jgi:hypothetical protein